MVAAEYTTAELAVAAGMTERNVRAYRQRGLLDPPRRHGRRGYYGPDHLAQLRTVRALLARGLSLAEIEAANQGQLGESARELLLAQPASEGESAEGQVAEFQPQLLESLALQRPGVIERLLALGVIQLNDEGHRLIDAGLLARTEELLALGVRIGFISEITEAAASVSREVSIELLDIATLDDNRDPRSYIDVATWSFREGLRHWLAESVADR